MHDHLLVRVVFRVVTSCQGSIQDGHLPSRWYGHLLSGWYSGWSPPGQGQSGLSKFTYCGKEGCFDCIQSCGVWLGTLPWKQSHYCEEEAWDVESKGMEGSGWGMEGSLNQ